MKSLKKLLLALSILFLASCGSNPSAPERPVVVPNPNIYPGQEVIRYEELKNNLGVRIPAEKLGYWETPFSTCAGGAGFSNTNNCRMLFLAIVHYKLSCRDTDGTISETLTKDDIHAVGNQNIKWTIAYKTGFSQTDSNGLAEIAQVFTRSPRNERIRLSNAKDFLYMRVRELTSVVAPKPWCGN